MTIRHRNHRHNEANLDMNKKKSSRSVKKVTKNSFVSPNQRFNVLYIILTILILWSWQEYSLLSKIKNIPYSEFKQHVRAHEVSECAIEKDALFGKIVLKDPSPKKPDQESFGFRTVRVEDPRLVEDLEAANVKYEGVRPGLLSTLFTTWILPIGFMVLIWFLLARFVGRAGQSVMNIGRNKARLVAEHETGVTFDDVAGCDEAQYELREVVDFLKKPDRYRALGAQIPKGALLVGPPGCGKTLLARAVAGEAKVPFFSMSGSDFVEMFVGVGAARVRDLFKEAKAKAPCIIFIDEMDAVGAQRGAHVGTLNDEREQTLNQLLTEMDGFEANQGVIILAATNRPEVLDRALLRPGRFDRQIVIDSPDLNGREAILKIHACDKPLSQDVDFRKIAQATPGFSGADLANTLNEAALLASRRSAKTIAQQDIEQAIEKVIAGPERKSRRLHKDEKRRVAYHETGHALVAVFSKHADPVHKITIVPRGRAALGYTLQLPDDDQFLQLHSELFDKIKGLLGGRAAEEIMYNEVSTGAQNDIEKATIIARQMVMVYGMDGRIGLVNCGQRRHPYFLAAPESDFQPDCSAQTAREIDEQVKKIIDKAYVDAKKILSEHKRELNVVADELVKVESLDGTTFLRLVRQK